MPLIVCFAGEVSDKTRRGAARPREWNLTVADPSLAYASHVDGELKIKREPTNDVADDKRRALRIHAEHALATVASNMVEIEPWRTRMP